MDQLLNDIRACTVCRKFLPYPPKPIIQASITAKILLIGQAPGRKVQESGVPWDDASGKELRRWLCVTQEQFYDEQLFALLPMGLCYPGKGGSGDLPPRPECAPLWHKKLLSQMGKIRLTILIGTYAHKYYLPDYSKKSVTELVLNFNKFQPEYIPLVHPSPRNKLWQKNNPWFEQELIPDLQNRIKNILQIN